MSMFWPSTPRDRLRVRVHRKGSERRFKSCARTVLLSSRKGITQTSRMLSRLNPPSTRLRMAATRQTRARQDRSFPIRRWSRIAYP